MDCRHARRRISELLDGAAADAALERHLASCAACARALARGRAASAALAALPEVRPGPTFDAAVLAELGVSPAPAPARTAWAAPLAGLAGAWTLAAAWLATELLSRTSVAALSARAGLLWGRAAALCHVAADLLSVLAPSPRFGAELGAAAVLAAAALLMLSTPPSSRTPLLGARP